MLQLNNRKKLHKDRKRVGRGGDLGGTSGKGHKGQKARSGGRVPLVFEGGQMPLSRRLPQRGFNNKRFQKNIKIINLQTLENHFESGSVINKTILKEKNIIKGSKPYVLKILGSGTLSKNLTVHADCFSESAKELIEKAGGQAQVVKE